MQVPTCNWEIQSKAAAVMQRHSDNDQPIVVYTILQESYYLIFEQIPAYHLEKELLRQCSQHGNVIEHSRLDDHPRSTDLAHVFLIKFDTIASARKVKRKMDDTVFYGGQIRVYYAPDRETVEDTRRKLNERQAAVLQHLNPASRSKPAIPNTATETDAPSPALDLSSAKIGPQKYPSNDMQGIASVEPKKRRRRI
ncbi:RNA-binding protein 48 [Umbelopsis nana]